MTAHPTAQSTFRVEHSELEQLATIRNKLGWTNGQVVALALDILGDGEAIQLLDRAHQASGIPRDQIAAQALESYCNKIIATPRGAADERLWNAWNSLIAEGTPPSEYRLRQRAATGAPTVKSWMQRNRITPEVLEKAARDAQKAQHQNRPDDDHEEDTPEEDVAPPPPLRKGAIRL